MQTVARSLLVISFLILLLFQRAVAAEEMEFLYHPPESELDHRYDFHWQVLDAALDVTKKKYGNYKLKPTIFMTEDRQVGEMKKKSGTLTVMIREASVVFDKILTPVRIPIDKGLIGYRVMLIKKNDQAGLAKISSLDEFKKVSMIQGQGWGDVDILKSAGFDVTTEVYYDNIFTRLSKGSITAFPRGVTEVQEELELRKNILSNLTIEPNILLYYELPIYFWFTDSEQGKLQAKRVDEGMHIIMENGKYDVLFNKHYSNVVDKLGLKKRKLFKISNPYLPKNTPFKEKKFWYDPTRDS